MSHRGVFLDRDGVLNATFDQGGVPVPPRTLAEFRVPNGVPEACAALRRSGWVLVVVSNQPDIARGRVAAALVEEINAQLRAEVPLDDIIVCPHDDRDACACRKPGDGMLREGARRWDIDLSRSFMVGDRWRDIEAGRRAGCRTILIDRGYEERSTSPDYVVHELPDVLPIVLGAWGDSGRQDSGSYANQVGDTPDRSCHGGLR